jgi:hypothetical protein
VTTRITLRRKTIPGLCLIAAVVAAMAHAAPESIDPPPPPREPVVAAASESSWKARMPPFSPGATTETNTSSAAGASMKGVSTTMKHSHLTE